MIRRLKRLIKGLLRKFAQYIPAGKYIMFESVPNLSDSPKAVYDELVARGYGENYKFVWWLYDGNVPCPELPNTVYVSRNGLWNNVLFWYYLLRSKCLISCNRFLETFTNQQTSVYITHGMVIKNTGSGYCLPEKVEHVIVSSEGVKEIMAEDLCADIEKFHGIGYPRNDDLHCASLDLHAYFETPFKKAAVWYPTFRQHKNGKMTGTANALPIIHDADKAKQLNEIASRCGVLIIVKPHFAQDINYITNCDLSNIKFIDDKFFVKQSISSYEFVGSCDALITDYSSIYYDFLLCDKPVAAVWEDIEDYRKNPGFAVDEVFYMKGAEKIFTLSDFEQFIQHLSDGTDLLAAERAEINAIVNYSNDGKSAARVADFVIDKAKL